MKFRFLIVIIILFSLNGCFIAEQIDKDMQRWIGGDVPHLLRYWGQPQEVYSDGRGGQAFVYSSDRVTGYQPATSTSYTTANANISGNQVRGNATTQTVYTPAKVYGWTAYRIFFINEKGRIYSYSWKGL